jgi:hypothetical protein
MCEPGHTLRGLVEIFLMTAVPLKQRTEAEMFPKGMEQRVQQVEMPSGKMEHKSIGEMPIQPLREIVGAAEMGYRQMKSGAGGEGGSRERPASRARPYTVEAMEIKPLVFALPEHDVVRGARPKAFGPT